MTKERIREYLLKEAAENICYFYKNINTADIEKIINKIPETEYKPQIVQRKIKIDKERLFENNVSNVIKYLSSYKDYKLCERCDDFVFIKEDFETYDEILLRIDKVILHKCKALSEMRKEKFALDKQKKELQDKIACLNKQIKVL